MAVAVGFEGGEAASAAEEEVSVFSMVVDGGCVLIGDALIEWVLFDR